MQLVVVLERAPKVVQDRKVMGLLVVPVVALLA
jgi:hypothetical protein